jgi:hypothetical protein
MTDTTTLIGRYFSLAPQADVDAYFAQFAEDAIVEDEGVQQVGIDAIRAWRTQVPESPTPSTTSSPPTQATTRTSTSPATFPAAPPG